MISIKRVSVLSAKCIASTALILIMVSQTCRAESEYDPTGDIQLSASYTSAANFQKNGKDLECEVKVLSSSAAISIMDFNITYTNDSYSWDKLNGMPFGNKTKDPWKNLHSISAGYNRSDMLNDQWGYFWGANVSSEFEKEMSDSYSGVGYAGFIYDMPKMNLVFRFGGGASYNEIETTAMPVIGIDWNSNAPVGLSASIGMPETKISYRFDPQNALVLSLTGESGVFRLADDSTAASKGYFESESYGGMLAYIFQPTKRCQVTAGATYYLDRQYNIYDRNGENKKEYDLDNAVGGFVSASFQF